MVNPSDKEVATISALVGVEEDVLKTPLDDEERSRYENEDDYSLVLVDIPVIEEEAAYYSYFTIPLGAVIKDDCMITVCLKDTAVMRDFARGRIRNFATFKKTRFLFQILYNLASKYLAYLKQIDNRFSIVLIANRNKDCPLRIRYRYTSIPLRICWISVSSTLNTTSICESSMSVHKFS